ncbi:hypothetical protein DL766_005716 [Monosporascus sp. MC13-8B]|uniref:Uncharacterized protein n=1 Tax=Monosporascus cannonballus TaxID=155416 RepID=A0ABY0H0F7_9PEZI|nr:hypothetical protein DL762_006987 [Monosporascus cannonballus]RYO86073.1 hypothetical protein DL763_006854 [Monosporascus cannonballus]RYP28757.1 hypothetical protein DL766_005716 [Monosporascus sp. MC13-8B]
MALLSPYTFPITITILLSTLMQTSDEEEEAIEAQNGGDGKGEPKEGKTSGGSYDGDKARSPTARALLRGAHGPAYDEDAIETADAPVAPASYSSTIHDSQPAGVPTKMPPSEDELVY